MSGIQLTRQSNLVWKRVGAAVMVASAVLTTFAVAKWIYRDSYKVLAYDGDNATATVRELLGTTRLNIRCYGSLDKSTDLSKPGYRTSPDTPATWEGVVGTDHWWGGCRPLPIGFTVTMYRQKYPANYLDYDTAQENLSDIRFSHSYWEVLSER
jgi:hypothetical protein